MSSFTTTEVVVMFPALSMAVPTTVCPTDSVVTVTGAVQEAIPVNASAQLKVTVGSELCQPDAFAAGVTVAVMVGGVVSVMIVAPKLEGRVTESK